VNAGVNVLARNSVLSLGNLGTSLCFERAGLQSRRKSNQCNAALAAEGMLRTCAEFP
jgi:hypothetical protein